ncbi:sugar phosphate isomerase/epimerase family protein [Paenibacillus cremeus]|uniref:Sugar phosphate isomerase/epimerase n=1 Tax=Paenibacillus cremeus TaxID=2163881 RepID=A0A559KFN3_9BACL|nr:TIM barrel protein [Paenibacillus cremeus]TVY10941.1 sugar phosphate isomerase/epimerase [Paenibacillus cremeus]
MKLELQQSWWAMSGVGNGAREWTTEEKFEALAEAGFTGILGRLPEPSEADRWRKLLDDYGFSFGVHAFPFPKLGDDLTSFLKQAKDFRVQYVNAQVQDQYTVGPEAVDFLNSLITQSEAVGIPLFIETHRGRITQDLLRTVDYVQQLPRMRLSIDFSHYVVGGAMDSEPISETTESYFHTLLERASSIHARVSNGHQVQVDIGDNGDHPMVRHFVRWWRSGMQQWRKQAKENEAFYFVCELGPPSYAIQSAVNGKELSDRFQQALVLKRLGEEAWRKE